MGVLVVGVLVTQAACTTIQPRAPRGSLLVGYRSRPLTPQIPELGLENGGAEAAIGLRPARFGPMSSGMAGTGSGTPGHFSLNNPVPVPVASFDSATASCRNNPSACLAAAGMEVTSVAAVVKVALEESARMAIEDKLKYCADMARSEVLLRYSDQFKGSTPGADECNEETMDGQGRKVTWAVRLGTEMHAVARQCAENELKTLQPGRFSLEQRYRYDRSTGQKQLVTAEQEALLKKAGDFGELKGTLKPDVVIHTGTPLDVQAVYDFKFPCANTDKRPQWREYPEGHQYEGSNQGDLYQEALGATPRIVAPRLGVF